MSLPRSVTVYSYRVAMIASAARREIVGMPRDTVDRYAVAMRPCAAGGECVAMRASTARIPVRRLDRRIAAYTGLDRQGDGICPCVSVGMVASR